MNKSFSVSLSPFLIIMREEKKSCFWLCTHALYQGRIEGGLGTRLGFEHAVNSSIPFCVDMKNLILLTWINDKGEKKKFKLIKKVSAKWREIGFPLPDQTPLYSECTSDSRLDEVLIQEVELKESICHLDQSIRGVKEHQFSVLSLTPGVLLD